MYHDMKTKHGPTVLLLFPDFRHSAAFDIPAEHSSFREFGIPACSAFLAFRTPGIRHSRRLVFHSSGIPHYGGAAAAVPVTLYALHRLHALYAVFEEAATDGSAFRRSAIQAVPL